MKDTMPEISFERSMNHNYMILSKCSYFGNDDGGRMDYRTKMLLENHIPGLLPVTHRRINGECRYYYEINSLQSLDRLYDKSEIQYDALKRLLSGCVRLFDRLEEYLLDGTQIIVKSDLIYIDVEKMEPYFVCYPDYEGDVRLSFMEFIDELLTKIDHTDERAVMLGYQIYRYTRNPNYVISEIGRMIEHVIVDMLHREGGAGQQDLYVADNVVSREWENGREGSFGNPHIEEKCIKGSDMTAHVTDAYDYNALYDAQKDEISDQTTQAKTKNIGDLIGGIFCIFVSLCAGAIILGARLLHSIQLSGNNELYLCGAMSMAVVAAILFFSCYLKKRRHSQEMDLYNEDDDNGDLQFYTAAGHDGDIWKYHDNSLGTAGGMHAESVCENPIDSFDIRGTICDNAKDRQDAGQHNRKSYGSAIENWNYEMQHVKNTDNNVRSSKQNETVYLGDSIVEERMLCGRINGREVNISLDRLPMTVGKLANMVDFVINDTAVSKMHARFEEHDGRIYLCDLNSTNGTVCNGVLLGVNQSVALEPGDRLRFGRTCFTYC